MANQSQMFETSSANHICVSFLIINKYGLKYVFAKAKLDICNFLNDIFPLNICTARIFIFCYCVLFANFIKCYQSTVRPERPQFAS